MEILSHRITVLLFILIFAGIIIFLANRAIVYIKKKRDTDTVLTYTFSDVLCVDGVHFTTLLLLLSPEWKQADIYCSDIRLIPPDWMQSLEQKLSKKGYLVNYVPNSSDMEIDSILG